MLLSGEGAERPIYLQSLFFVQINELEQLLDLAMPEDNNWFYMEYDGEILLNRTPYTKEELLGFDMEELGRNKTKMTGFTQESEKNGFSLLYSGFGGLSLCAGVKNMQVILLTLAGVFALAGIFPFLLYGDPKLPSCPESDEIN